VNKASLELFCDAISVTTLARKYGTPLYIYSATAIRERLRDFKYAFRGIPHTVCYSVKANSNLSILGLLSRSGYGFDVVSGGELQRVLKIQRGSRPHIVFSGVGKTVEEIDLALKANILLFNVESESELYRLAQRAAKLKKTARLALRVNPDVPAETHPYISTGLHQHKFGVPINNAVPLYAEASKQPFLQVAGVSVHIGSQIMSAEPFGLAVARVAELIRELRTKGHAIKFVDAGGGLGISYEPGSEHEPFARRASEYAKALCEPLQGLNIHLLLEPGRAIVGPAGALITTVQYVKSNQEKQFLVVDAAMNDLIRPSLYGAFHEIVPVHKTPQASEQKFDVVGPICETGDFFARDRKLPRVAEGDLLAILDTGAYGMAISSNYNSRFRAAEVLVDGKKMRLIRRRESLSDMLKTELV
jgi:diaminopimelate decarboxylase